jgi:hypothetical protein
VRYHAYIGARRGLWACGVVAPLAVLVYLMALRSFLTLAAILTDTNNWLRSTGNMLISRSSDSELVALLKLPALILTSLIAVFYHKPLWGSLLLITLVTLGAWISLRRRTWLIARIAGLSCLALIITPLLAELDRLLMVAVLAILVWGVPSLVLGIAAPLLQDAANQQKLWGILAFIAASIILILRLLGMVHPVFFGIVFILVLSGILFRRGIALTEYWPLAAFSMAMMVGGLTVVWQKATFFGLLGEVHAIHNIPSVSPDPMQACI